MAFTGTFDHTLDAKNRLTVPSRFRAALSGKVFLVAGDDPCISVWPEEDYMAIAEASLADLTPLSPEARQRKRRLYARAIEIELDGAGRVMLPGSHMEHAGLTGRQVLVQGAGDSLELWDRDIWQRFDADFDAHTPDPTAPLGHPA